MYLLIKMAKRQGHWVEGLGLILAPFLAECLAQVDAIDERCETLGCGGCLVAQGRAQGVDEV